MTSVVARSEDTLSFADPCKRSGFIGEVDRDILERARRLCRDVELRRFTGFFAATGTAADEES